MKVKLFILALVIVLAAGTYYLGMLFKYILVNSGATMITINDIAGCYVYAFFIMFIALFIAVRLWLGNEC